MATQATEKRLMVYITDFVIGSIEVVLRQSWTRKTRMELTATDSDGGQENDGRVEAAKIAQSISQPTNQLTKPVIPNRLVSQAEQIFEEEQAAFTSQRSTTEQIF